MSMPPPQPPGWYHAQGDPPGTQRWWDGAQWVGGPAPVAPVAPPVHGAPGPVAPGYGYGAPAYGAPAYGSPGYGYGYGAPVRPDYASWWARLGATLLDRLILGVPLGIVFAIVVTAVPTETKVCTDIDDRPYLCDQPTGSGIAMILLTVAVAAVITVAYFSVMHARTGQTLGKKALGIAVVDKATGQPLSTGRSVGRTFGYVVSGFICSLGFLWAAWDAEKQAWHDKMVNSIVVRRPG